MHLGIGTSDHRINNCMLYEFTSTIENLASFRYQRREEIEATESLCSARIQGSLRYWREKHYPQCVFKGKQPREDEKNETKYPLGSCISGSANFGVTGSRDAVFATTSMCLAQSGRVHASTHRLHDGVRMLGSAEHGRRRAALTIFRALPARQSIVLVPTFGMFHYMHSSS